MRWALWFALCVIPIVPHWCDAQSFGVGPAIGIAVPSGNDFANLGMGFEYGLSVRYTFPVGAAVGLGARVSEHPVVGSTETVHLGGLSVQPRYTLRLADSTVEPVFGVDLGIVHEWTRSTTHSLTADGFGLGISGGMRMRVSRHVAVEPGVAYSWVALGNSVDNGVEVAGSKTHGAVLGIFVDLRFVFDGGAPAH